jgi:hypothetical protein
MKKTIRLTEGDLHRIIKESVNRIISENEENEITNDYIDRARRKSKFQNFMRGNKWFGKSNDTMNDQANALKYRRTTGDISNEGKYGDLDRYGRDAKKWNERPLRKYDNTHDCMPRVYDDF